MSCLSDRILAALQSDPRRVDRGRDRSVQVQRIKLQMLADAQYQPSLMQLLYRHPYRAIGVALVVGLVAGRIPAVRRILLRLAAMGGRSLKGAAIAYGSQLLARRG